MPNTVLGNDSPYSLVFKHDPNYRFLKVFGCACFPFLRLHNTHKLEFRFARCVFLGYSNDHKGYLCLHFSSRIYIGRHVLFNEHDFPFPTGFSKYKCFK